MWTVTHSFKVYTLCKGWLTRKTAVLLDFAQITRDGRGSYFFHGAGKGRGREHTACISWLKSYAADKEILICIALSEVNLLNIHNLDLTHN